MKQLNFLVQIKFITDLHEQQSPVRGYFRDFDTQTGFFSWILKRQTNGDIGQVPATEGVLLENWCPNITKNIDVRRNGAYSTITNGNILVENATELYTFMKQHGIQTEGCKLVIYEVHEDGSYNEIFSGVGSKMQYNRNELQIGFEDATRYRDAIISTEIAGIDEEEFIPVIFGELEKAKLVSFKESIDVYTASEEWATDPIEIWFGLQKTYELYELTGSTLESLDYNDSGYHFDLLVGSQQAFIMNHFGNWIGDITLPINSEWYEIGKIDYPLPPNIFIENVVGDGSKVIRRIRALRRLTNVNVSDKFLGKLEIITDRSVRIPEDGFIDFTAKEDPDYDPQEDNITYFKMFKADFELVADLYEESGGLLNQDFFTFKDDIFVPLANVRDSLSFEDGKFKLLPESLAKRNTLKGVRNLEIIQVSSHSYPWKLPSGQEFEISDFSPVGWGFYDVERKNSSPSESVPNYNKIPSDITVETLGNGDYLDNDWENGLRFRIPTPVIPQIGLNTPPDQLERYYILFPIKLRVRTNGEREFKLGLGAQLYTHHMHTVNELTFIERTDNTIFGLDSNFIYFMSPPTRDAFHGNPSWINRVTSHVISNNWDMKNIFTELNPTEGVKILNNLLYKSNRQYYADDLADNSLFYLWMNNWVTENETDWYGWRASYTGSDLLNIDITNVPVQEEKDEYDVNLTIGINVKPWDVQGPTSIFPNGHVVFDLRHISLFTEEETDISDGIYTNWKGREEGGQLLDNPMDIYRHICKLQNYKNEFTIPRPNKGWGLEIPDGDLPIEEFPSVVGQVARQIVNRNELFTRELKNDLLKTMWSYGYMNELGKEEVRKLKDAFNESPEVPRVEINMRDIVKDSISKISDVNISDVFSEIHLDFDYDIATDEYKKKISVTRVDAEEFDPSYVVVNNGIITDAMKLVLWSMGRQLYVRYGVKNEAPQTLTQNNWIRREIDAFQYLQRWYAWQGASQDLSYTPVTERREVSFDLPYEFARHNNIQAGTFVKLKLPFMEGVADSFFGLINNCRYEFRKGREVCKVNVIFRAEISEVRIYGETGYSGTVVVETGTREENIVEGEE